MARMEIPKNLKEENQYGAGVQSLALTLMNEGYVSMARTKEIIDKYYAEKEHALLKRLREYKEN